MLTDPLATIEGFVELIKNIPELPERIAAYYEKLEGLDAETFTEKIAEKIAELFTQTILCLVPSPKGIDKVNKVKLGKAGKVVG